MELIRTYGDPANVRQSCCDHLIVDHELQDNGTHRCDALEGDLTPCECTQAPVHPGAATFHNDDPFVGL